ncbi:hypothetical protein [Methylorubrum suomiense]|uniref:Uncharacterized protein n=1 Tax=Methylorubrum suomiense TaxID=144191 RepID=A0ABQ4UPR9_9HYPH|nr:hypothetical protein [Methylorubrum suomiense]GJE74328.1 hypothetical protein BGCPKDLD_0897 [Methylorubrum suomiense]
MADKWTSGLRELDARQTRQRLAMLMDECRFVSQGLEIAQGEGLRDQVTSTELALLRAAKGEIERLAGMLAEFKSGPPPAPAPYDAFAAARARAEAKAASGEDAPAPATEPAPAPVAPSRQQMPVRGARLPRLLPGRPASARARQAKGPWRSTRRPIR